MMFMRIAIVISLLFIAGCVISLDYDSDPAEFSALPATHGVVVFQVVNMNERLGPYLYEWRSFRARRIGGGPMTWLEEGQEAPRKYIVYPDYLAIPGTTFWVGVLPAGNYLAEDLFSSFSNGEVYSYLSAPIPDTFASFTIKPGKVTLLDAYLYNGLDSSKTFLMSNVESADDLLVKASDAFPAIMSAVDIEHPLRFPEESRNVPLSGLEEMASRAETHGMSVYAPDGRVYRPARLGQIFERTPEGIWRRIALPTFESVQHVFAAMDGEAIVVTQGGRAFHRISGDGDFVEMPLEFDGCLRSLVRTRDGQWVATVVRTWEEKRTNGMLHHMKELHELELLKSARIETPDWQTIAQFPVESRNARAMFVPGRAITADPGGTSMLIDLAKGSVRNLRRSLAYLRVYEDGQILGYTGYEAGLWGMSPAEIWLSRDNGSTWEEFPGFKPKGMPELMDDDSVLIAGVSAIRTKREALGRDKPFEGILTATVDSPWWEPVEKLPKECNGWVELKRLESGLLVLCEYEVFRRKEGSDEWISEDMRGVKSEENGV